MKVIRIDNLLIANNLLVFLESLRGTLPMLSVAHYLVEFSTLHFCHITKGWGSYELHRHKRYSCTFEACVSPASNRSAIIQSFKYATET